MKNILFTLSLNIMLTLVLSETINDILNNLNTDFLSRIDKTAQNINTETIQYGLGYNNSTVVKVFIKLVDDGIKNKVNFVGFLKSKINKKEYILNCSNPSNDLIVCLSEPGIKLNTEDRYYMYYNRSRKEKIIFDYENILEDDKRINLIFQPELYENQTVYRDNKKIMAQINKKTVGEGYLYIVNQKKKILNNPKDGFNKYIELNNFVFTPKKSSQRESNIEIYEEAIRRGYHMIEAEVQFTKDNVPIIYNKQDEISSKSLNELLTKGKILTLFNLLKKCKKNKIIVELKFSFMNLFEESSKNNKYIQKIMQIIEENEMFDSLFFNLNQNKEFIAKLLEIKNDISISISNLKTKEDIEKIKDNYKKSKRIIYNLDINFINKELVKYILSLGNKIKVSTVNNKTLANKFQLWGVNYIATNNLPPFLIQNEKEEPFIVKCVPIFLDDLSECKMGKEIILRDNEKYNIHYSLNIYNKSEDINETSIGEFRYEDTKINDMKYYIIKFINFNRGLLQLITSHKVDKGKIIKGVMGPKYDNVAECYQYNFICEGNNQHFLSCEIDKEPDKVVFNGEYAIYYVENYSYNEEEIEDWGLNRLKSKHVYSKQEKITYTFFIILISIIFLTSSYYIQTTKGGSAYFEEKPKSKKLDFYNNSRRMERLTDVDGNELIND